MLTPAERRYSCADSSQRRQEPVWGTASTARGWLLVEEPGPWGSGTVPSSRLGEQTTRALREVAAARSSRLLLIRRPLGRDRGGDGRRLLFRAVCRRGGEQLLVRTAAPDDLARAAADDLGWSVHPDPLLLVCTHGRKDWCCALRGRPVAAALADADPGAAWECSHLGGDRFAASVLTLPTGIMYGRVDATDAAQVSAATRAGHVVPRLLRGRSTDALVVQAADAMTRQRLGRTRTTDLAPVSARRVEGEEGTWDVVLDDPGAPAAPGEPDAPADRPGPEPITDPDAGAGPPASALERGAVVVRLRESHVPGTARLTCSAPDEQHARTWELVDLARASARSAPAA